MSRYYLILLALLLAVSTLFADVPRTISYQGRLTDNGVPVNGAKSVTFKIYDRSANSIWNSGIVNVTFTEGLFTVELGQSPQPPLFVEGWSVDTAMSLGVTIAPNRELSQRLHFKTVPYAMHALTAESAGSGGGWLHGPSVIRLENSGDYVGLGTNNPSAKLTIKQSNSEEALLVNSSSTSYLFPAMELNSATTGAVFHTGGSTSLPGSPRPAIFCQSEGDSAVAAWFRSGGSQWPTVIIQSNSNESAIIVEGSGTGYALDSWTGKGIRAVADSATAIRAETYCGDRLATVLSSAYTGSASYDHIAVSGYSRPADYYGIGGRFEGGYRGVLGHVYPEASGDKWYVGVDGAVGGGAGTNCAVYGNAYGGVTNYGVYGNASGGATDWAGYFSGDVNVTGSIVKAAGTQAIDHPSDPDNKYLQQSEIVSDNLKAVYDGMITLGADGSAVVQLPDYLESFCGDFRYQLTCVGGYAPVYVSSEIAGSQFAIAGGKAGLKVSWQITGIRKDKYAQAHPLEVEKKKTASEQGKYLHPELYGRSADRSLSPNPERDASVKGKNDAIRATAAALAKPSTPPKQPVMMEKK